MINFDDPVLKFRVKDEIHEFVNEAVEKRIERTGVPNLTKLYKDLTTIFKEYEKESKNG